MKEENTEDVKTSTSTGGGLFQAVTLALAVSGLAYYFYGKPEKPFTEKTMSFLVDKSMALRQDAQGNVFPLISCQQNMEELKDGLYRITFTCKPERD